MAHTSTLETRYYSFELCPVLRSHLGSSLVDYIVDSVQAIRLQQGVNGGAELRVLIVHLATDLLDIGLDVANAVDELLKTSSTLLVVCQKRELDAHENQANHSIPG